jgi:hypothetical protein
MRFPVKHTAGVVPLASNEITVPADDRGRGDRETFHHRRRLARRDSSANQTRPTSSHRRLPVRLTGSTWFSWRSTSSSPSPLDRSDRTITASRPNKTSPSGRRATAAPHGSPSHTTYPRANTSSHYETGFPRGTASHAILHMAEDADGWRGSLSCSEGRPPGQPGMDAAPELIHEIRLVIEFVNFTQRGLTGRCGAAHTSRYHAVRCSWIPCGTPNMLGSVASPARCRRQGSKWFPVDVRLIFMTRFIADQWSVACTGAATAAHILAWPCAVVMVAAAAAYRLAAEGTRRKTLVELVTRAPAGTIVIMESGPGGPAMWLRVGSSPADSVDTSSGGVAWATGMQGSRSVIGCR